MTFAGAQTDQVVQSLGTDKVRMLTVLKNQRSQTRFAYRFPGYGLERLDSGHIVIFQPGTRQPVGMIGKAWAKDATGAAVATSYRIHGSTLNQQVQPTDSTVYPVVADPTVDTHWWGWSVKFNRSETRNLTYGTLGCSWLGGIPTAGWILAAACGTVTGTAAIAYSHGNCLAVNGIWGSAAIWPWYWNC